MGIVTDENLEVSVETTAEDFIMMIRNGAEMIQKISKSDQQDAAFLTACELKEAAEYFEAMVKELSRRPQLLAIDLVDNNPLQVDQFRAIEPGRVFRIEAVSPAGEVFTFESAIATGSPTYQCTVDHSFDASARYAFSTVTGVEETTNEA